MTNRDRLAPRTGKANRSAPGRSSRPPPGPPRPDPGDAQIAEGIRMRCQELSADLAVIRFECVQETASPAGPPTTRARRNRRPTGAS